MQGGFPNIRHMRVFIETARTGSVSAAADLCNLSQPAASQALSRLEADLGAALLVRRRQRAALTNCGRLFAQRTAAALHHLKIGALAAYQESEEQHPKKVPFDLSVTATQLRNLIAISNSGSFSIAAKALGLSQPSVHRTARSLEAVAGVPFFIARPSGVRLTPSAAAFVLSAKLAQSEIRQGIEEISHEKGLEQGTFVLGSLPLARTSIVPKAVHTFVSSVEGVQVKVVDGRYTELLRSLREGDLDCMIGALRHPTPADDVKQEFLFNDELAIVAHPNHPLIGQRLQSLDETLNYPWIAPPKDTPAGQYLFETLCIQDWPTTPVRVVSSSLALLRGVLAEGPYLSIVSRHQIKVEEALGGIATLDIPLIGHRRQIGLTYRHDWEPTETQSKFIGLLRKFAQSESAI